MKKSLVSLIALLSLASCTTTNRTGYEFMFRDKLTYQGIKTESEKDNVRYGLGVQVLNSEERDISPGTEDIPFVGEVAYEGEVRHNQLNINPEIHYMPWGIKKNWFNLETRTGLGTEIQIEADTYTYDIEAMDETHDLDGPILGIDIDNNFYLSGMILVDIWKVSTYLQTKFDQNKEFGFAGGVGLIW